MNIEPAPIPPTVSNPPLPGVENCGHPSSYLEGAQKKKPQRKKRQKPLNQSARREARERAELLQAAILLARGRLQGEGSPFDPQSANPFRPDNSTFLETLNDASVPDQQR